MCGELDENAQVGHDVLDRLKVMTRMLGLTVDQPVGKGGPTGLFAAEARAAYMQSLFNAGLVRALNDSAAADPEEVVDAIAGQAIAFARLAGFLAGQLPPEADLFRTSIEALMEGHSETARLAGEYSHKQDHLHGHSHDHHH